MEVGEKIEIWGTKTEVKAAWEKEGPQFFICEDKEGWIIMGVLCLKKDETSLEIVREIGNNIFNSLELIPQTVKREKEKYIAWAMDITDVANFDKREVKKIRKELELAIEQFDERIRKNHPER